MSEVRYIDPNTGGEKGKKPQNFGLVPPEFLYALAEVFEVGAQKYAPNNWRRGYPWSLSYNAALRHLLAFWHGEEFDEETGLPHLVQASWHLCCLFWMVTHAVGTDDRYLTSDTRMPATCRGGQPPAEAEPDVVEVVVDWWGQENQRVQEEREAKEKRFDVV